MPNTQNFYLRRAYEYEGKAHAADNLAEKCALEDAAQAYRDISLYAHAKSAGLSKETDAEVQALAERMTGS